MNRIIRWAAGLALGVGVGAGASQAAPPSEGPAAVAAPARPVATVAEARKILRTPRGSLSFGSVMAGRLDHAAELPFDGSGYAVFPHFRERDTNHGTAELVGLIGRVAKRVAKEHPGSVLGVGNMSVREGGQTGHSVSHKSGRDADLGMFARTTAGAAVNLRAFVAFDHDGRGGRKRQYVFDDERNLALVLALLEDTEAPIQWIFVADWLKARMVALARERGVAAPMLARMDEVLHQPSDSNPHHHHFHIRIFCSVQDRLYGCLERPPRRAWVELGDAAWQGRVEALMSVLRRPEQKYQLRAIEALATLRARPATGELVALLGVDRGRVRDAALEALELIAAPESLPGLLGAMARTDRSGWTSRLWRVVLHIGQREAVGLCLELLADPSRLVDARALPGSLESLQRRAAQHLGVHGREPVVPALRALLGSPSAGVRGAAHRALLRVTNQRIKGSVKSRSAKRVARVVAAWDAFFDTHGDADWLAWMKLGFEARGYDFDEPRLTRRSVPVLIEAVGHRDEVVSHNAVHALSAVTGHEVDPRWRKRKNNKRHWLNWWRDNGGDPDAPPAP